MKISAKTKICLIIGDPVEHSLSPQMHNAGYAALGIEDKFVYVAARVKEDRLAQAMQGLRALNVRGITITHPHKQKAMHYVDSIDETAQKIGAINTIVNDNGKLIGKNTDWIGVVASLEEKTILQNKKVAIIGAGGAARAAVFAVAKKGANVTIFNRSMENAIHLANEFNCNAKSFADIKEVIDMDIVINLTPTSMQGLSLIPKEYITNHHIVFDAVYSPLETKLLKDAKDNHAIIIQGIEWLLHQGFAQFEMFTGEKAPQQEMKKEVLKYVS